MKNKHDELKAEYEEALEKYDVVKVSFTQGGISCLCTKEPEWNDYCEYKLRFYNINHKKVPKGTELPKPIDIKNEWLTEIVNAS